MDNPMEFDNNTIKLNSGIDPEWEIKITKVLNGYIMTYLEDASVTEENKLFGKYVGLWFWHLHIRGNKKKGIVVKDYEIERGIFDNV